MNRVRVNKLYQPKLFISSAINEEAPTQPYFEPVATCTRKHCPSVRHTTNLEQGTLVFLPYTFGHVWQKLPYYCNKLQVSTFLSTWDLRKYCTYMAKLTPHLAKVSMSLIKEPHLCGHICFANSTVTLANASFTYAGSRPDC